MPTPLPQLANTARQPRPSFRMHAGPQAAAAEQLRAVCGGPHDAAMPQKGAGGARCAHVLL